MDKNGIITGFLVTSKNFSEVIILQEENGMSSQITDKFHEINQKYIDLMFDTIGYEENQKEKVINYVYDYILGKTKNIHKVIKQINKVK